MKIYKVGGAVRDALLNIPFKDSDWVVVGARADDLLSQGFQQVGKDFPVFLHPKTHEEYALARTERKNGKGYTGFTVHASPEITLEEDLYRRDLTINAMALSEEDELIDPYGGQQDLELRILRHVSPAFAEDPLRVLRVAKFSARLASFNFTIAPETLSLMKSISQSGELLALVPERVWQETSQAIISYSPAVYFKVLQECGALKIIFPELEADEQALFSLTVASKLSNKLSIRFAALCSNLDGPTVLNDFCKRLRVPNECSDLARLVLVGHRTCHKAQQASAEILLELLEHSDAFRKPERFADFLIASEANYKGCIENSDYPQAQIMTKVLELANTVKTSDIIEAGFTKEAIAKELRRQRIELITDQLIEIRRSI